MAAGRRSERVLAAAEVEEQELIGRGRLVVGGLDVDSADPVAVGHQEFRQVVPDEATGSGDQDSGSVSSDGMHCSSLLLDANRSRAYSRANR